MSDKDDKKPKPDDMAKDAADNAAKDGPVTDDQEVVEVVVGQTAVPVTDVETDSTKGDDTASDADATVAADEAKPDDAGQAEAELATDDASVLPPPVVVAAPRRADRGARFLAFIAVLIALGVGATTILPQVRGGSADRIAQLQSEIDALTVRNRTLTEKVDAGGTATAAAPVDLSGVEARLTDLEAGIANVSGLQDRLATLESTTTTAGSVPTASDAASTADIAALRAQIAAIAAAAPTANAMPQGSGDAGGVNDALRAELNGLEERLAAIERNTGDAGIATGDLRDSLAALRDRMEALASEADALSQRVDAVAEAAAGQQSQADAEAAQKAALVLALGRLRDVATTSSAFPGAWNSVVELGVDPASHAAIADAAQHGIATVDDLRQRFAAVADAALTAERIGGDDTWYGSAFQRLGNLVSVRRVGDVEGTSVEAILTRAEYRLEEGNLEAALAELNGLSGPPAEAIASWRSTAEARLELEQAIRALQQGIFQNMAQEN